MNDSAAGPECRYANLFRVGHNAFEVILEFGQSHASGSAEVIHSRIVTGPSFAKAFLMLLSRSIDEYEREFGAIRTPAPEEESNDATGD